MTDRGPDSAGIAVYGQDKKGRAKLTVQSDGSEHADFDGLGDDLLGQADIGVWMSQRAGHRHTCGDRRCRLISLHAARVGAEGRCDRTSRVMSAGDTIEIYKEVGLPGDVADAVR